MRLHELISTIRNDSRLVEFVQPRAQSVLVEVVLHEPAEIALGGYIERAPSEETKKWIGANFKNWMLKQPENLNKLGYLPRNATPQQQKAFQFQDLWDVRLSARTQSTLEHILDWFQAVPNPPRLERMSVENVVQAADQFVAAYNKKQAEQAKQVEPEKNYKVAMEFPGGYRMLELRTQAALDREGNLMVHCVGSNHGCFLKDKTRRFFSLRDPQNQPHATIEVHAGSLHTTEIKGKQNVAPVRRYWPMIQQFVQQYGIQVDSDHHNIGLIKIDDPETGREETLTQDQFKDILHNPDDPRGKHVLADYETRGGHRMEQDKLIGIFNALYGSEGMTDALIEEVFGRIPSEGIQVIQHYGNRMTPEQIVLAFSILKGVGYGTPALSELMKEMIAAIKPTPEMAKQIFSHLQTPDDKQRRYRGDEFARETGFIAGLFQVMPDVYADLILSDPEKAQHELNSDSQRAAGPFFASIRKNQPITPELIKPAFEYFPGPALKAVAKLRTPLDPPTMAAAILGVSSNYNKGQIEGNLDRIIAQLKPDAQTLNLVFERINETDGEINHDFAAHLLLVAKRIMPENVDRDMTIRAVMAVDKPEFYQKFLQDDPNPPLEMQDKLLNNLFRRGNEDFLTTLSFIKNPDPAIWKAVYSMLTPEEVEKTETDTHDYIDDPSGKMNPKTGKPARVQSLRKVPKSDSDLAKEYNEARHNAAKKFMRVFSALLADPGASENNQADKISTKPDLHKVDQARAAFEQMGKSKLFDTAMARAQREHMLGKILHSGAYNSIPDENLFSKYLKRMTSQDIGRMIRADMGNWRSPGHIFAELINQAPERLPEVILHDPGNRPQHRNALIYGELKQKGIEKDQMFQALEAVWGTNNITDGYKDALTVAVFKRFKPKADQLTRMLERAHSEEATIYVLKKTKRPAPNLVKYVWDNYPNQLLLIPLEFIPDEILTEAFRGAKWENLANRDLRGYRSENNRSKYASYKFHDKIDRSGEAFKKYQDAAERAGKSEQFASYARGGELEDKHDELMFHVDHPPKPGKQYGHSESKVNYDLLKQHLNEWSLRSLIKAAQHTDSHKVAVLYFKSFSDEKLAILVRDGIFGDRYHWSKSKSKIPVDQIGLDKMRAVLKIALQNAKDKEGGIAQVVSDIYKQNIDLGEDIALLLIQHGYMDGYSGYSGDSDIKSFIGKSDYDSVKDWIAENKPIDMGLIERPNEKVIEVLYQKYGNVDKKESKDDAGKVTVSYEINYWFVHVIEDWFSGGKYPFKYRENPEVERMMRARANELGGIAETITDKFFQVMAGFKSNTNAYAYFPSHIKVETKTLSAGDVSEDD